MLINHLSMLRRITQDYINIKPSLASHISFLLINSGLILKLDIELYENNNEFYFKCYYQEKYIEFKDIKCEDGYIPIKYFPNKY